MSESSTDQVRKMMNSRRSGDIFNPVTAALVAKLPRMFEAEVNAKLDELQERLHTRKK
jgi:hypothetical protein